MPVSGCRVGIVGGSIAGCAAAIAARRNGWDVTVFERGGDLRDRGYGIAVPQQLHERLVALGYFPESLPACRELERVWLVRDDDAADELTAARGRVLGRQQFTAAINSWRLVRRALRDGVADTDYRADTPVIAVRSAADGALVRTADGRVHRFDLVIGAEGYRSTVRGRVDPAARPRYAGYVLWRGICAAPRLRPDPFAATLVTVCFPGGHGVFYRMPGTDDERCPVTWAVYHTPPPGRPVGRRSGPADDDMASFLHDGLATTMPPYWAELLRATPRDRLFLQPVSDTSVARYTSGRLLLAGDAGAVVRPHTASGATKALQDALALDRLCREQDDLDGLLTAYDRERRDTANRLVDLGRRIGATQVLRTPRWEALGADEFRAWLEEVRTPYTTPGM